MTIFELLISEFPQIKYQHITWVTCIQYVSMREQKGGKFEENIDICDINYLDQFT